MIRSVGRSRAGAATKPWLVVRWEYLAGSAVLLVWSREQGQSRDDRGRWRPVRDWQDLWSAPATDIVMLKLTQWFAQ